MIHIIILYYKFVELKRIPLTHSFFEINTLISVTIVYEQILSILQVYTASITLKIISNRNPSNKNLNYTGTNCY